ncbi:hypothetical protein [Brevundimonas sp.]|uniref:hypothetical protein n=1 Tax=Brevundimonas sp. TaxID=1871086 RepID=UPI0028A0E2E9|nr:hypothetical protein [Brevundimonas sp.]
MKAWTQEEIAWARECLLAGDAVEEVAEAAGCTPAEVLAQAGTPRRLTAYQRDVLSLYLAGASFKDIDLTTGRNGRAVAGKAACAVITKLRRNGHPIPHRNRRDGTDRASARDRAHTRADTHAATGAPIQ